MTVGQTDGQTAFELYIVEDYYDSLQSLILKFANNVSCAIDFLWPSDIKYYIVSLCLKAIHMNRQIRTCNCTRGYPRRTRY